MNGRERILTVFKGDLPDRVPVSPFVQEEFLSYIYPGRKVDRVKEAVECAKHFDFDLMTLKIIADIHDLNFKPTKPCTLDFEPATSVFPSSLIKTPATRGRDNPIRLKPAINPKIKCPPERAFKKGRE